jgi:hypothetical protein
METTCSSEMYLPTSLHGVTTQNNNVDFLTVVRSSNLMKVKWVYILRHVQSFVWRVAFENLEENEIRSATWNVDLKYQI